MSTVVPPPAAPPVTPSVPPAPSPETPPVIPAAGGTPPPETPPVVPPGTPPVEPPKPFVPEKYDLKLSDETLLDASVTEKIATIARAQGLSNEQAQTLLESIDAESMTERNTRVTTWNDAVKADKELGGGNLAETQRLSKLAVDRFAPAGSDIQKLLAASGYFANPGVVRFFRDLGKAMAEDRPPTVPSSEPPKPRKTDAEVLYDHPTSQQQASS